MKEPDLNFPPPTMPPTEARKVERPSPLTGIANAWVAVVAVIFFFGRDIVQGDIKIGNNNFGTLALISLGILLLIGLGGLLIGIIQWRTTTFIVDAEFRIEKRFLFTTISRIDFTKVQSVDITRPIVARILGLAEVAIDVGGQGGKKLRYLTLARAEALRDTLLARMRGADDALAAEQEESAGSPGAVVYRAIPRNLILGAVLSASTTCIWIAITISVVYFGPFGTLSGFGWLWFGLLAALWQIPNQFLANWGFTIYQTPKGLRIERGALTRTQTTLRPERIQTMLLRKPLFHRIFGLTTVRISVLGNNIGEQHEKGISILTPFGKADEVRHVIGLVWPGFDPSSLPWQPQAPRGRWLTWFGRRWYSITPEVIATRRCLLSETIAVAPHVRVQGLGITEGPVQRLLGLAGIEVQTIQGAPDLSISHLSPDQARRVFADELHRSTAARLGRTDKVSP